MRAGLKFVLKRVSEGDAFAFREIFDLFSPKVYAFSLKLTRSQSAAEEMVQEVFLKLWLHRQNLSDVEYFPSYLYTITRNLALNVLKRRALEEKAKISFSQEVASSHSQTEETIIFAESQHLMTRAIDGLPPQQKLIYRLCHGEGLKYEEVARRLRISRLTVKTHMQQALRSIREHLRIVKA